MCARFDRINNKKYRKFLCRSELRKGTQRIVSKWFLYRRKVKIVADAIENSTFTQRNFTWDVSNMEKIGRINSFCFRTVIKTTFWVRKSASCKLEKKATPDWKWRVRFRSPKFYLLVNIKLKTSNGLQTVLFHSLLKNIYLKALTICPKLKWIYCQVYFVVLSCRESLKTECGTAVETHKFLICKDWIHSVPLSIRRNENTNKNWREIARSYTNRTDFQSLCDVENMNSNHFRKSRPRISLRLK